ncbi:MULTISPECIES: type II toxin-antitoxin system VapC family toxin [Micromonospora]|uniref:Type II toxin-antitoxin system VapC family toxin n=1 Tax=Micromonospora solifontis TaxID=2487138 RepID=A0ABX9WCP8_9ACTN|nr:MULTISPECIES: type II toxin-antitoxin system VapC family toxin [Micromonospora]NES16631.1 type II toxin-antitoxin system VapC family toxin [Micromonospora sp. PPF5-17B]NES38165.1 type II toxin-antitoxin system VapC family toxin [Micromonospora solifontis]NES56813.1 type II toxin-antitoxin system VapC family toxin [Micromonospora sp. PPF5-6]RNL96957.1 type II toxin-antitoxin system VapC family toxin [Micromonospora solifontis]
MSFLLDTHVVLWWLTDDPTLSDDVKDLVDNQPEVYLSAVTVWEVAIKQALGKLAGPPDLAARVCRAGLRELPIRHDHAVEAGQLPPIHRDPFDRMLVAQARHERLTLVTRDGHIQKYDVPILVA